MPLEPVIADILYLIILVTLPLVPRLDIQVNRDSVAFEDIYLSRKESVDPLGNLVAVVKLNFCQVPVLSPSIPYPLLFDTCGLSHDGGQTCITTLYGHYSNQASLAGP